MAVATDIGTLISQSPDFKRGRPVVAGTGVTVQTIATYYRMGESAEDIARKYAHLTLAQVYAALAYYHANRTTMDAAIDHDDAEARRLEQEWRETRAREHIEAVALAPAPK